MKNAPLAIALAFTLAGGFSLAAHPAMAQSAMSGAASSAMSAGSTQPESFISGDAKTTGTGRLITKGGKTYVELSKDFTIGMAPAIYVTLYRDAEPPKKKYDPEKYVSLGRLKSRKGGQRYLVPASVKLDEYQSIAIWCKQFDVTLAHAPLER